MAEEKKKIDPEELKVGTEVEKEHTDGDPKEAKKIATDHLKEPGHEKYYTDLNNCDLIDEPKAKALAKKYLVNEHQIKLIAESVMTEGSEEYREGDEIVITNPSEEIKVPPYSQGKVLHVDAMGTLTVDFMVNGAPVRMRVHPEYDEIIPASKMEEWKKTAKDIKVDPLMTDVRTLDEGKQTEKYFIWRDKSGRGEKPVRLTKSQIARFDATELNEPDWTSGTTLRDFIKDCYIGDVWETRTQKITCDKIPVVQ